MTDALTDPDMVYLAEWDTERDIHVPQSTEWVDPADDFWLSRPILGHIYEFARARRAGPWGVLGMVLARVVASTPPFVVLPPLVGDDASLNTYVGLVGVSGGGKGAAEAAAAACLDADMSFHTAGVGSGEGLAHLFARRTGRQQAFEMHTTAVMLSVPEIDTMAALGGRSGATIMPELRKAWVGEGLGFAYADPTKHLPIASHSYRLCLSAGIQPKRAGFLLDDSDAGTPQRFIWMPVTDPSAPENKPEQPTPWAWKLPQWPVADYRTGRVVMPVCQRAQAVIDAARLARLRGTQAEANDAHSLLAREKVAAGLSLLDGRFGILDEDWDLSGLVMNVSDLTRARVIDARRMAEDAKNKARGRMDADRAVIVQEKVELATVRRIAKALLRKLKAEGDWVPKGKVRQMLASRDREMCEQALDSLNMTGEIDVKDVNTGDRRYIGVYIRFHTE
jgi:hypothetical protein